MENKKKNSLKPTKKSKKHSKSKVIEDVRTNEERKKEIYTKIFAKTGLPEDEIIDAHEKCDEDYPQGKITKEEFNEQSEVTAACIIINHIVSPQIGFLSDALFRSFDTGGKGTLDFCR